MCLGGLYRAHMELIRHDLTNFYSSIILFMHKLKSWRIWLGVCLVGSMLFLIVASLPARAAPQAQFTPFPTPTPGTDGRIIYIVQANDSWWRIAAIHAIDLNELLRLNDATSDTILLEGEEVLLGFGGPAEVTPTAGPRPTSTSSLPTPTPQPGSGTLCVILYNDINGDSIRQEEEPSIPDGAISVNDQSGETSLTETTLSGFEPLCFGELMQGEYTISVAVPDGFNPTTVLNYVLVLDPGTETYIDFGAQVSSVSVEDTSSPSSSRTILLGIAGGVLVLGGIGLGVYAALMGRTRTKSLGES